MTLSEQTDAIMAVPIGAAVIACALGFFFLAGGVLRHVIAERAARRAWLRDMADRMSGGAGV